MMTRTKARFVLTTALTAAALVGGASLLSACGKLGTLEQAPPIMNKKAEAAWSTSMNADGGVTTTTSASASRASERAEPDANGSNSMSNPYSGAKSIQSAPLEGFGNAATFNNNSPK